MANVMPERHLPPEEPLPSKRRPLRQLFAISATVFDWSQVAFVGLRIKKSLRRVVESGLSAYFATSAVGTNGRGSTISRAAVKLTWFSFLRTVAWININFGGTLVCHAYFRLSQNLCVRGHYVVVAVRAAAHNKRSAANECAGGTAPDQRKPTATHRRTRAAACDAAEAKYARTADPTHAQSGRDSGGQGVAGARKCVYRAQNQRACHGEPRLGSDA